MSLIKTGDWDKLNRFLTVPLLTKTINKFAEVGTKRAGLLVVRNIRMKMRSVSSPPNSPITVRRKGSTKPWIDEGDMIRAVTSIHIAPLQIWVGVPAGKTDRETGMSLARIARVLEGGEIGAEPKATVIKPKGARALFVPLKRRVRPKDPGLEYGEDFILVQRVRIRPRPVIGPAVKESKEAVLKIYEESVAAGMRALLGVR